MPSTFITGNKLPSTASVLRKSDPIKATVECNDNEAKCAIALLHGISTDEALSGCNYRLDSSTLSISMNRGLAFNVVSDMIDQQVLQVDISGVKFVCDYSTVKFSLNEIGPLTIQVSMKRK